MAQSPVKGHDAGGGVHLEKTSISPQDAVKGLMERFQSLNERLTHMAVSMDVLRQRMQDMGHLASRVTSAFVLMVGLPRVLRGGLFHGLVGGHGAGTGGHRTGGGGRGPAGGSNFVKELVEGIKGNVTKGLQAAMPAGPREVVAGAPVPVAPGSSSASTAATASSSAARSRKYAVRAMVARAGEMDSGGNRSELPGLEVLARADDISDQAAQGLAGLVSSLAHHNDHLRVAINAAGKLVVVPDKVLKKLHPLAKAALRKKDRAILLSRDMVNLASQGNKVVHLTLAEHVGHEAEHALDVLKQQAGGSKPPLAEAEERAAGAGFRARYVATRLQQGLHPDAAGTAAAVKKGKEAQRKATTPPIEDENYYFAGGQERVEEDWEREDREQEERKRRDAEQPFTDSYRKFVEGQLAEAEKKLEEVPPTQSGSLQDGVNRMLSDSSDRPALLANIKDYREQLARDDANRAKKASSTPVPQELPAPGLEAGQTIGEVSEGQERTTPDLESMLKHAKRKVGESAGKAIRQDEKNELRYWAERARRLEDSIARRAAADALDTTVVPASAGGSVNPLNTSIDDTTKEHLEAEAQRKAEDIKIKESETYKKLAAEKAAAEASAQTNDLPDISKGFGTFDTETGETKKGHALRPGSPHFHVVETGIASFSREGNLQTALGYPIAYPAEAGVHAPKSPHLDDYLSGKKKGDSVEEAKQGLEDFLQRARNRRTPVFAHNAPFDEKVLQSMGGKIPEGMEVHDTAALYRRLTQLEKLQGTRAKSFTGEGKEHSLENMARDLLDKPDLEVEHGAAADSALLGEVVPVLLKRLKAAEAGHATVEQHGPAESPYIKIRQVETASQKVVDPLEDVAPQMGRIAQAISFVQRHVRKAAAAAVLVGASLVTGASVGPEARDLAMRPSSAPPAAAMVKRALPEGTVMRHVDADTIIVADGRGGFKTVRVADVDAPERGVKGAQAATEASKKIAPRGSRVRLEGRGKDKYGREVHRVLTGTGKNLGHELIAQGHGWADPYDPVAVGLAQAARSRGLGVWDPAHPERSQLDPRQQREHLKKGTLPAHLAEPKVTDAPPLPMYQDVPAPSAGGRAPLMGAERAQMKQRLGGKLSLLGLLGGVLGGGLLTTSLLPGLRKRREELQIAQDSARVAAWHAEDNRPRRPNVIPFLDQAGTETVDRSGMGAHPAAEARDYALSQAGGKAWSLENLLKATGDLGSALHEKLGKGMASAAGGAQKLWTSTRKVREGLEKGLGGVFGWLTRSMGTDEHGNDRGSRVGAFAGAAPGMTALGFSMAGGALRAGSPDAFAFVTESFKLLAGEIGIALIPAAVQLGARFQEMAFWLEAMSPAQKESLGSLIKWGLGIGIVITGLVKLQGILQMFGASLLGATGGVLALAATVALFANESYQGVRNVGSQNERISQNASALNAGRTTNSEQLARAAASPDIQAANRITDPAQRTAELQRLRDEAQAEVERTTEARQRLGENIPGWLRGAASYGQSETASRWSPTTAIGQGSMMRFAQRMGIGAVGAMSSSAAARPEYEGLRAGRSYNEVLLEMQERNSGAQARVQALNQQLGPQAAEQGGAFSAIANPINRLFNRLSGRGEGTAANREVLDHMVTKAQPQYSSIEEAYKKAQIESLGKTPLEQRQEDRQREALQQLLAGIAEVRDASRGRVDVR